MPRPSFRLNSFRCCLLVLVSLVPGYAAAEEKTPTQFFQERGYEPIKLQRLHANHLLAPGLIGHRHVRCLIDTGATLTMVDKRLAAGWPKVEKLERPLPDIFGKDVTGHDVFMMQNLGIGRCAFPEQPVVAVDMRPDPRKDQPRTGSFIPRSFERLEFDVVLGLDFLRRHHVLIDCHGATAYIRPDPPSDALAASIEESFRRSGYSVITLQRHGLANLRAAGSIGGTPVQMLVDTGAWVTMLDRDDAKALGLKVQDLSEQTVGASGAKAELDLIKLGALKLGNYDVPPVRVGTASMSLESDLTRKADGSRLVGLLGPDVLAFNSGIIDCHGAKLYLKTVEQASGGKK